jgi:putative ABC transport system ATP-binding protein
LKKCFLSKPILRDISFEVKAGTLSVIEGKNGVGKSTLFNILSGLIVEDGGAMTLADINLSTLSAKKRATYIAVLRQDPKTSTVGTMSVLENCALALLKNRRAGLWHATSNDIKEKACVHLASLGLHYASDLKRPLLYFSGGQRQLLVFAIATLHKPSLLLLDEPSAALDEEAAKMMMNIIKRFVHIWNIPAVMISHDHELNRVYADHIYTLQDGMLQKNY